jgi:hypothetical protein
MLPPKLAAQQKAFPNYGLTRRSGDLRDYLLKDPGFEDSRSQGRDHEVATISWAQHGAFFCFLNNRNPFLFPAILILLFLSVRMLMSRFAASMITFASLESHEDVPFLGGLGMNAVSVLVKRIHWRFHVLDAALSKFHETLAAQDLPLPDTRHPSKGSQPVR